MLTAVFAASLIPTELPAPNAAPAAPPAAAAQAGPVAQPAATVPDTVVPAPVPIVPPVSPADVSAPATSTATPAPVPAAQPTDQTPPTTPGSSQIVVSGEQKMQKVDPVEGANKVSFAVIEGVDKALIGPIMHGYRDGLPRPIRAGLHNFFFNLTEPVNALNYMLQLHPGKALRTVERFGINSTVGVAGLIDVAKKKPFHIYYRPNGFGNTFGYWGIGPGPYLFLPLVGSTSVRDLIGSLLDQAALPLVVKPLNNYYYVLAAGVITELDYRVDIDAGVERVRKSSNVYASYRQAYFRSRYEEIEALHGRGPLANGEIGQPPFVRPLTPGAGAVPPSHPERNNLAPSPAAPAPATMPAPATVPAPAASAPAEPLPPVFVSHPVIQTLPVVQPLPPGYRPGGS